MKTLTEFPGVTLKQAAKTKAELVAAGKTPEELPAAFGEAMKLEGDKLTILLTALESVESRLNDLKRVVVFAAGAEGEKAPSGATEKDGKFYLVEHYPSLEKRQPEGRGGGRGGKGGKGGKDGKRGGRGGRDGDRGRGPGGPGGDRSAGGGGGRGPGGPGRGPRPEGGGRGPNPAAGVRPSGGLPKPRQLDSSAPAANAPSGVAAAETAAPTAPPTTPDDASQS